jgi:hypothetical protein
VNAPKEDLLRAIELALAGNWDAAHNLIQQYEDDATAAWIHAVLHKIEGDLGNARYWYRRADRMEHVEDEPRAELSAILNELTADKHPKFEKDHSLNR